MPSADVTDALRQVPLFAGLSPEQFALVLQGTEVCVAPGQYVAREGDPPAYFHVLLSGRLEWTKRAGQQEVYVISSLPGHFWGHELLLTNVPYPVSGRALTEVRLYRWDTPTFWCMVETFPTLLRGLIPTLAERWQNLGTVEQQHARLVSLGTMAAGLAHELNNPAAAATRACRLLHEAFAALPARVCRLNKQQLSPAQQDYLVQFVAEARERARAAPALDTLIQSDHEEEVAAWLRARGVAAGWEIAPTFVKAGVSTEHLDVLAERLPAGAMEAVTRWVEAALTTEALLAEMEQSCGRISALVETVKSYSYLDQAPLQEVDVHEGLEDTLIMLAHRLNQGGVEVTRAYDPDLPRIRAYGSELNQVWTNLLDNALDAAGSAGRGHVTLRTAREPGRVLVEIEDDGPGIPDEIQGRVFDPFFTTKEVGAGTGMGLDIARRIVAERHGGDIRFQSTPGMGTRFQVRLPIGGLKE